jgi:PTS system mannose-specific IID component
LLYSDGPGPSGPIDTAGDRAQFPGGARALGAGFMKPAVLFNIFLRSLTIQASFSFSRMQGLGFAFSMLPLLRRQGGDPGRIAAALARHLERFNTHPYLTAPLIGSLARVEEQGNPAEAEHLKSVLMSPYAAIGDVFFWGALRSFCAVTAVLLALLGVAAAPLAFLILYNPAHLWVRAKGFIEGYRQGKNGIAFIGRLDLPGVAKRIRNLSLVLTGLLGAVAAETACDTWGWPAGFPENAAVLAIPLLFLLGLRRGLSPVAILYGTALLCMVNPI